MNTVVSVDFGDFDSERLEVGYTAWLFALFCFSWSIGGEDSKVAAERQQQFDVIGVYAARRGGAKQCG